MQIQLTDAETTFLEEAAKHPSQLKAEGKHLEPAVIELLLAMQLVVRRDDMLEITILGLHLLKLARNMPRAD